MWAEESVIYQIYPLGMCGAPYENDGVQAHRILEVKEWIPHLKKLGITAVYFCPVFESDTHGYNTRDYKKIDCRLGTNEDFKEVCGALHENGIRIFLDGVFNHVGRGFHQFKDVLEKRWDSPYKDWFNISFDGNSPYNDGLWYEGWEGNYDLVKLNLRNEAVIAHIFDAIRYWVENFDIDGLRLDVAYCLDRDFIRRLRSYTDTLKQDFYLIGEILGGDYKTVMGEGKLHSATNYECYKGLFSSFNSMNMFEVNHSLMRQFGSDPWCLYRGYHLLSFVDNHDVTRVASVLTNKKHLPLIYALAFGMPGIPSIYYGSEWGVEGHKNQGDPALRPRIEKPEWNELTDWIATLAKAKRENPALTAGNYRELQVQPLHLVFQRKTKGQRIIVAINIADEPVRLHFNAKCGRAVDLLTGEDHDFGGGSEVEPFSCHFWLCER